MKTLSNAISNRLTGLGSVLVAGILLSTLAPVFAAPITARKADSFVDSIGVNIHLGYEGGVYGDFSSVKTRLQEMGIRHTRDGFEHPSFKQYIKNRHNDLGRSGIKGTFIAGGGLSPAQILQSADLMPDAVEAIEGQNEILNIYVGWDQAKRDAARQYQIDLFNAAKASSTWRNTPVLGPTCVGNNAYQALGNLSAYMDYGNGHIYPLGPAPAVPESGYFNEMIGVNYVSPGKQIFGTETGYTTGTSDSGNQRVSPAAAGKYAPRLYLENFNRGILRSYWYELADQGTDGSQESTFGLVNRSFAYKPQGTAIRNLTTLLKDATFNTTTRQWVSPAFTAGSLDYTLSGNTANVHSTLLQKSNGKFYLCLWQEINSYNTANNVEADINNPDVPVTLTLNTPIASAVSYWPTNSTTSISLTIFNNTISLSVPDQVLIVELTPVTSTQTTNLTPTGDTFVRDGSYAGTANSSATTMTAKNVTSGSGYTRWSYIKFDTTGLGTISSAKVRLYGNLSTTLNPNVDVSVYGQQFTSSSPEWSESTLTWNNKTLPLSTALATKTVTGTGQTFYEWDVTAFAQSEASAGRRKFGLVFKAIQANIDPIVVFNTKEAATNKPVLVVQSG